MVALAIVIGMSSCLVLAISGKTERSQVWLTGAFVTLMLVGWAFSGWPVIGESELLAVAISGGVFLVLSRLKLGTHPILERETAAKAFVGGTLGLLYSIWIGF